MGFSQFRCYKVVGFCEIRLLDLCFPIWYSTSHISSKISIVQGTNCGYGGSGGSSLRMISAGTWWLEHCGGLSPTITRHVKEQPTMTGR